MFFGIGAYGIAIASARFDPTWGHLGLGVLAAVVLSAVLSILIGLLSLRVRAIFYTMITLAVAAAFQTLSSQRSDITGGDDGLTFSVPEIFSGGYHLFDQPIFGVEINGKIVAFYMIFSATVIFFLAMLRIVNSPFGRVLLAIRENVFRAEAIGYNTVIFRTIANVWSAVFATLAGSLWALWLAYNGPDSTLSFQIMIDILLIIVIGGMGTMYGAICGATIFFLAENYLRDLIALGSKATQSIPWLSTLLSPDRWLLWLGVLYVLSVYFLATGIVGRLRTRK
jgi:branched-chain amino acid transport system permease protein